MLVTLLPPLPTLISWDTRLCQMQSASGAKPDGTLLPKDFWETFLPAEDTAENSPWGEGARGIVLLISPKQLTPNHKHLGFLLLQKAANKTATFGVPVSEPVPGNGKPSTELTVHPPHHPSFPRPRVSRDCFSFWQIKVFGFVCYLFVLTFWVRMPRMR